MKAKRTRRAPSADWLAMTPADREAVRQSRLNAQSTRRQRENASEKAYANASPRSSTK